MKPATKRANITQRQANAAVRAYIRKKPYTARGISRVPCLRCGAPSRFQWNICSLPGQHGVCADCDVALNAAVLDFMRVPNAGELAKRYAERVRG